MLLSEQKSRAECRAYEPPEDIPPTEWCRKYVRFKGGSKDTSVPFDPDKTPYLREILDSIADPMVWTIAFVASTQTGKTTVELCFAARCCAQRPGDILWVMPTEDAAKAILEERVKPMIEASPVLRQLVPDRKSAWRKDTVELNGNSLFIGYPGSPTALASRPLPYVLGDEAAKWPLFSGDEGDPVKMATERNRWFPYRATMLVSTPKDEHDIIWREWLKGDQRSYWVPCPHCFDYQVLEFEQIKLKPGHEEERDRATIIQDRLADYHCVHCDEPILDDHKPEMMRQGVWCPEGCEVVDGLIAGDVPRGMFRSYRVNCLYSPMLTWSEILAEFFDSKDDIPKLRNFVNSWLAKPWKEKQSEASLDMLEAIEDEHDEGVVPEDARVLGAAGDVQHGQVWYVVRAYGGDGRSWLVEKGIIDADPEESDLVKFANMLDQTTWRTPSGREMSVTMAFVDSGDGARTHEVYDLSLQFPHLLRPCKGEDTTRTSPVEWSSIEKWDGRRRFPGAVELARVNTDYFKSRLVGKIRNAPPRGRWGIPHNVSTAYRRSIVSEQKVVSRNQKGVAKATWKVKPGFKDNHWWDAEVYVDALAHYRLWWRLKSKAPGSPKRRKSTDDSSSSEEHPRRRRGKKKSSWISSRGGGWR